MKYTYVLILIIFIQGCKLATPLLKRVNDNLRVSYDLFYNNRTAKHKPIGIYVSVDTLNTRSRNHSLYLFHFNSNTVEKFQNYGGQRNNYILTIDSSNNNATENLFSVTNLESEIFDKVIYFSDSLKLKDFHFLMKAKGFKISLQKLGYYSKTK